MPATRSQTTIRSRRSAGFRRAVFKTGSGTVFVDEMRYDCFLLQRDHNAVGLINSGARAYSEVVQIVETRPEFELSHQLSLLGLEISSGESGRVQVF